MKYKFEGTVTFAWEAEIVAESEQEARDIAESGVLEGDHLDLTANDLGTTKLVESK